MRNELIRMLNMVDDEDLQISVSDDIIRDEQVIKIRVSNRVMKHMVSPETQLAYLNREEKGEI